MKKFYFLVILLLFSVAVLDAQSNYSTYSNPRFSFSVDYPSDLFTMRAAPANNDGRTFQSKDGKMEMRVWGQFNPLDRTLREEYEDAVNKSGAGVSYKVISANSFVVSGVESGKIFYRKTLFRKKGETEVFYTLTVEYPPSLKNKMDAVVTRISKSFKFDPNADI